MPSGQWGQRVCPSGDGEQAKSQVESWRVGSVVLAEDQDSIPNTYMVNHNHLFQGIQHPSSDLYRYREHILGWGTQTY